MRWGNCKKQCWNPYLATNWQRPHGTPQQPLPLTSAFAWRWSGSPGATRTPDQRFRKPLLYPSELRGHSEVSHCNYKPTVPRPARLELKLARATFLLRGFNHLNLAAIRSQLLSFGSYCAPFCAPALNPRLAFSLTPSSIRNKRNNSHIYWRFLTFLIPNNP